METNMETNMENQTQTTIKYIKGNIFDFLPNYQTPLILCHICNDLGIMGAGIALGITQFIPINNTLIIANMIAQHDLDEIDNIPPIRYDALENCLNQVANYSKIKNAQVIGPKFGAGLAGGDWNIIEKIIQNKLCNQNVQVTIFEL